MCFVLVLMLFDVVVGWAFTDINYKTGWRDLSADSEAEHFSYEGFERVNLIYPGTKWCGSGDIADDYDDLGDEVEADKCCRQHDHCSDTILSGETKHNLTNYSYITKLNCSCDERFQKCLSDADDKTSTKIGIIYFNIINQKCFREDYPVIKCVKRGGFFKEKCVKYTYDTTSPKKYQWFDVPPF